MPLTAFDHVNIRTSKLDEMVAFYGEILGLHPGWRPNFRVGGAWLYLGDQPYIHLVDIDYQPATTPNLTLEHFSFRATGMKDFTNSLDARDIPYSVDPVPGITIVQVNFHDPDGNHIHVDFDLADEA
ncbi:VOC family protein [Primorskyibacter aestuariivivens]|uniref:VOC family protein n=1 Tax=Primorskyibacter aestuariivivens TaxID=1888912 RepID=UPI0023004D91|nr:VOC family protein [Primorskyibacter aestuariivivens]MDA7428094.1 VOC family protein [Primorskyibacter aestuariivivens]